MVKTLWSEDDNEIVCKNYLEGVDCATTAEILPHLRLSSIKMKYKNCLYLQYGNVNGSLANASKMHRKIWNKLVPAEPPAL